MSEATMSQTKHSADPTPPTLEGKLTLLKKLRDELGSGDTIRRLFFGDLEPIAPLRSNLEERIRWFIFITKLMMSQLPIALPTMYF
ncbi:hypothetical protein WKK05_14010 [Nostoc sp. UHCC 0302]|uniref:hypothetical protein n=1 Tax=Nostoc sp. UHCC 0302 TaxID=3134896 RepID=UPI00311C9336